MTTQTIISPTARETLLGKRYGVDPETLAQSHPAWNSILATLVNRHSARAFTKEKVTEAQLDAIVAAAQSAATSSNLQTWSVVAVEDARTKDHLSALAGNQTHVSQAPLVLIFVADLARLRRLGAETGAVTEGLDYFDSFLVSVVDASLAAQNAEIAANSLGLGGCFIGAMRNQPEEVAKALGLPEGCFAVFGLAIGHRDTRYDSDIKPRLPAGVVLHREQYGAYDPKALAEYDRATKAFEASQGMPTDAWTDKALERVSGPRPLGGRSRLREALSALGFGLR